MLKTHWVAPGDGATVDELRQLLGRSPIGSDTRTSLAVEPGTERLTGYDWDRAVVAVERALRENR